MKVIKAHRVRGGILRRGTVYGCILVMQCSVAMAQPAAIGACDILTAHPDDANRVAEPVPFNERDAARAVPACEEAVRQHTNQPRLRYQLGLAYDSARRHAESFSSYQQAANADYTAAGFALGWAYANGEGTPRDDSAAIRWYQWAAERGHSAAQNTLGFMYENGRGVTASLPQAADWYRRAHEAGRPIGSANYGRMLALGHGGAAGTTPALRRTLAVTVLRQAVQQDRADAALQLAVLAERGDVQIDRSELIHLWALAEARSTERERARRSLQRLAAQGAAAEIEQARSVVAQRQTVLDNERSAAREARESALRRLTIAAAQPVPSQPSVGGISSPPLVIVAPSPASGTASTLPAHGAGPASSSATPTAGLELLMEDRFAWAGIALGVALGVGGVGFWLGRRRGQQALKAAQALQRRTAVSAPSIADAYLAAKQASGTSPSAEKTKPTVILPQPPASQSAALIAARVAGSASEIEGAAIIQENVASKPIRSWPARHAPLPQWKVRAAKLEYNVIGVVFFLLIVLGCGAAVRAFWINGESYRKSTQNIINLEEGVPYYWDTRGAIERYMKATDAESCSIPPGRVGVCISIDAVPEICRSITGLGFEFARSEYAPWRSLADQKIISIQTAWYDTQKYGKACVVTVNTEGVKEFKGSLFKVTRVVNGAIKIGSKGILVHSVMRKE